MSTAGGANARISVRGLRKRFVSQGRVVEALAGVDLTIADGEFVCIVGPSGCGKTTLLRIVAGLEQQTSGQVEIARSPRAASTSGRAAPVNSMVFQEQSIFPWMSVRRNVAFGLKARGFSKRERHAIAERYITKVGLSGFEDTYPHQLSGGMKQRVSIARALANDPEILLMDEPFAALDEQTKLILQGELIAIWEESRKTVLYVTHSIDEAILLADRIVVMSARPGNIKDIVDVGEVFPRPRTVERVKSSPRFGELFGHVWEQLKDEVAAARMLEDAAARRK